MKFAVVLLLVLLSGCAARRKHGEYVPPECANVRLAEPCPLGQDGKLHSCKIKAQILCVRVE